MKVYRCCSEEEIKCYREGKVFKKRFGSGTNTFKYDDNVHYIHFFYFAECMFHYKRNKYRYDTKYYVEYDIPFNILKNYFGYGFYAGIIPGYYTPVPEFALPYDVFKIEYIKDIFDVELDQYLRDTEWEAFKNGLSKVYLADYELGAFESGYNEYSILDVPLDKVLSLSGKNYK